MNMQTNLGNTVSTTGISTLPTSPHIQAMWDTIDRLDLKNIKRKLMLSQPEGEGWTEESAELGITWYRRYLKLHAKYGDSEIRLVPNHFIDEVWHLHILDTRSYAEDCKAVFGKMLHHYPYFGMNGDAIQRDDSFDRTDLLHIAEFGESCKISSGQASMCDGDGVSCFATVRPSMCDGDGGAGCLGDS